MFYQGKFKFWNLGVHRFHFTRKPACSLGDRRSLRIPLQFTSHPKPNTDFVNYADSTTHHSAQSDTFTNTPSYRNAHAGPYPRMQWEFRSVQLANEYRLLHRFCLPTILQSTCRKWRMLFYLYL